MKNKLPGRVTTLLFLVFLSPLVLGSTAGPAERDEVEVPPNAHLDSASHGWECDRGYREAADSCVAVDVPANAYLGRSGHDWVCDSGYRREGDNCVSNER